MIAQAARGTHDPLQGHPQSRSQYYRDPVRCCGYSFVAVHYSRRRLGYVDSFQPELPMMANIVQPQLRSPPWHTQELLGSFLNNHTGCAGLHPELQGRTGIESSSWTDTNCSEYRLSMSCSDYLIKYLAGWSDLPLQSNSSTMDTKNRPSIPQQAQPGLAKQTSKKTPRSLVVLVSSDMLTDIRYSTNTNFS